MSIRRCSLELWLLFSFFLPLCVVFRRSFHVGYCNLHVTMAWIIVLKSTSEKIVPFAPPDVQEMKDKVFLMTRASWRPKSSQDLTRIKAQLCKRNKNVGVVLPCHSSEHTRELGVGTVTIPFSFRLEMKMWDYFFTLDTQQIVRQETSTSHHASTYQGVTA